MSTDGAGVPVGTQERADLATIVRMALSQGGPFFFTWVDVTTGEIKYCVYQAAPAWVLPGVDAYMRMALEKPPGPSPAYWPLTPAARPPAPQDGRI